MTNGQTDEFAIDPAEEMEGNSMDDSMEDSMEDFTEEKKRKIANPHDKFFKEFLSEKETAESFIREYLPPEITAKMDFATLDISKDSFVDKEFREHFADILYEIGYGDGSAFLYLLFEHKSEEDWMVAFQLLKYMVKIWETHLKQNPKASSLPVILPLVIYHGKREWRVKNDFISLFRETGGLEDSIPDFRYRLYDISHLPEEEFRGTVLLRVLFMAAKYVFDPRLHDKLEEIFRLFDELIHEDRGTRYLEVLLRYLMDTQDIPFKDLAKPLEHALKSGGDFMPTLGERLRLEGEQRGIRKGIREGVDKKEKEMVKNCLDSGLTPETIAKLAGVTVDRVNQIKMQLTLKQSGPIAEAANNSGAGPERRT